MADTIIDSDGNVYEVIMASGNWKNPNVICDLLLVKLSTRQIVKFWQYSGITKRPLERSFLGINNPENLFYAKLDFKYC